MVYPLTTFFEISCENSIYKTGELRTILFNWGLGSIEKVSGQHGTCASERIVIRMAVLILDFLSFQPHLGQVNYYYVAVSSYVKLGAFTTCYLGIMPGKHQ